MAALNESPPPRNGISVKAFGAQVDATGRDVILFLLLAVGFVAVIWYLDSGFTRIEKPLQAVSVQLVERQREHDSILRGSENLACMLALPTNPASVRLDALRIVDVLGRPDICAFARALGK